MVLGFLPVVFVVKILFTLLLCVPLLFFSSELFALAGIPKPINVIFFRLLGMAYVALTVGYIFGLISTLHGDYPTEIIWVGIVSNGGACLLLIAYGINGTWRSWKPLSRTVMWISTVVIGSISLCLIFSGLLKLF